MNAVKRVKGLTTERAPRVQSEGPSTAMARALKRADPGSGEQPPIPSAVELSAPALKQTPPPPPIPEQPRPDTRGAAKPTIKRSLIDGVVVKKGGWVPPSKISVRSNGSGPAFRVSQLQPGDYFDTDEPMDKYKAAFSYVRTRINEANKKTASKMTVPEFGIVRAPDLTEEEEAAGDMKRQWRVFRRA